MMLGSDRAVRVLHLCPLWFRVASDAPGGVETLLPGLVPELSRLGCSNTLLASGGSRAEAELVPVVELPITELMELGSAWEYGPYEQHQLVGAIELADDFDVIHSHLGWGGWALSAVNGVGGRLLHTQHNPVTRDMGWFVRRHPDLRISTVSEFQAGQLRAFGATRCRVVHNGLRFDEFPLGAKHGRVGLVFLGRLEREKGAHAAIHVAKALAEPLTIAGPMTDHLYYEAEIAPHLGNEVRYVGTLGFEDKVKLLVGATCVLMPMRGEEGFGLVALEAMACGTPVVALASGGLPEVIVNGVTGFVTCAVDAMPGLVGAARALDPASIRAAARLRFDMTATAAGYLAIYREIVSSSRPPA